MRKDDLQKTQDSTEGNAQPEAVEDLAPVSAAETSAPGIFKREGPAADGSLTAMMAMAEPARTELLEKAVESGQAFTIGSKSDRDVHVRHGAHILAVPPGGKPFTAGHAIHLLWTAPDLVEEVAG